jgi:hypothetical protein
MNAPTTRGSQILWAVLAATFAASVVVGARRSAWADDTTPPTVYIVHPEDQDTVNGTVTFAAVANDNYGVREVQFMVDEQVIAIDSVGPPFNCSWDTTQYADAAHDLQAKAVDTSDNEGLSAVVTVTVANGENTAPTAVTLDEPTNVGETTLTLSWSQNQDGDFASYKVYRDTEAGVDLTSTLVTTITQQAATSYNVTGLTGDTTYYFKVYVFDTGNLSSGSNEVDATTTGSAAPHAVTLNQPTNITSSGMRLTWSQNQDPDFASYKVYRDTEPGVDTNSTLVTTIETQTTTQYDVTQLSAETTYYFRVYVYDTEPLSTGSNEVSASTTDGEAPSAVTLNDPTNVAWSSMDLSWTKSTDSEFASYKLYRDTSPGVDQNDTLVVSIPNVNTTSYVVTGLQQSTQYYFKLYVTDVEDLSAGSNEVNATTTSDSAPAAVTLSSPTEITAYSMRLTWTLSSETDFAKYRLYRGTSPGVDTSDTLAQV